MMPLLKNLLRLLALPGVVLAAACDGSIPEPPVTVGWAIEIPSGMEGSPAFCDLDGDGGPELVFPVTDELTIITTVMAINPASGEVLWTNRDNRRAYAYPYCSGDLDSDGAPDVLVSGRSGDVFALSGADGHQLWSLSGMNPGVFPDVTVNVHSVTGTSAAGGTVFVSFRGDRTVPASGGVIAFDARSGRIRAVWEEPEGREIYSSPAVYQADPVHTYVALGSGGETLPGELFLLDYDSDERSFTVAGSLPSSCGNGGVVASPVFGDLDGDTVPELVASDYCNTVVAADLSLNVLWTATSDVQFGTSNPVLADFDGDGHLDVAAIFESFNWSIPPPEVRESAVVAVKGTDGSTLWTADIAGTVFGSPVTLDVNLDGLEDLIVPEAGFLAQSGSEADRIGTTVLDGSNGTLISRLAYGSMMGTPVIGDVDHDGTAELYLAESGLWFTGMGIERSPSRILRLDLTGIPYSPVHSWSGFRGQPVHDGYRE